MAKSSPKNHSYVYIPVDKLVAIIKESCPPIGFTSENGCFGAGEDCKKCWLSWLKDGEDDAKPETGDNGGRAAYKKYGDGGCLPRDAGDLFYSAFG